LRERIENLADEADLEEVYNSERHLLYAMLPARTKATVRVNNPSASSKPPTNSGGAGG
jgi:hypothetical protein